MDSSDGYVQLHEHLADLIEPGGLFFYTWVGPGLLLAAVVGGAFVPFLLGLPSPTRRRFVTSGLIYLSGALLMEIPLGLWVERAGPDNLTYGLIDLVEETLELLGVVLFLLALHHHRSTGLATGEATP